MPAPSDAELVRLFTEATEPYYSARETEERTGIGYTTVARLWRGDWKRLTGDTRRKILRFLEQLQQQEEQRQEAVDALDDLEAYAKFHIKKVGPPGTGQARKRDILRGLRIMITATEPLPEWWYDLEEEVERGEM